MGITLDQAFQSNYIAKGDCPIMATIDKVDFEMVGGEDEEKERKVVIHSPQFPMRPDGKRKGLIINKTNWINIEETYGRDTDSWLGKQIEVYADNSIMYGGKRVGGVRVRIPSGATLVPAQQQVSPSLLSWEQAKAAANAAGVTYEELLASLKANGRTGYTSARDTALVREIIAARAQAPAEQAFDADGPPPDDGSGIPF